MLRRSLLKSLLVAPFAFLGKKDNANTTNINEDLIDQDFKINDTVRTINARWKRIPSKFGVTMKPDGCYHRIGKIKEIAITYVKDKDNNLTIEEKWFHVEFMDNTIKHYKKGFLRKPHSI